MATANFTWTAHPDVVAGNVRSYEARLREAIVTLGNFFAAQMESHMKSTADWNDRTGAARQSLRSFAISAATGVVIYLTIGVSYGVFLMTGTRYMRPYPVIQRTMAQFHAPIMAALRQLVS